MKKLILCSLLCLLVAAPAFAMSDGACARVIMIIVEEDGLTMVGDTMMVSPGVFEALDSLDDEDQLDLIRFTLKNMKDAGDAEEYQEVREALETIKDATEHTYLN